MRAYYLSKYAAGSYNMMMRQLREREREVSNETKVASRQIFSLFPSALNNVTTSVLLKNTDANTSPQKNLLFFGLSSRVPHFQYLTHFFGVHGDIWRLRDGKIERTTYSLKYRTYDE